MKSDRNRTDWTDRTARNQTDRNWTDRNQTARPPGPDWMGGGGGAGPSDIRGAEASHQGSRIKDLGPCFGTNGRPRRDTDVILRQSKALFEIFDFI